MRYAIYVHDPDGDMGYGRIVGAYTNSDRADKKADEIRTASDNTLECIVLPCLPTSRTAKYIVGEVTA